MSAEGLWLSAALNTMEPSDEVLEYALGRGLREETIQSEGVVTWDSSKIPPAPESAEQFRRIYGPRGERLQGMLVCPAWAPNGALIGFEGRSIREKRITDFRLPEEKWSPFFLGLRGAMPRIWAGGDVWICEGLFDKAALEWAAPKGDAVLSTVRAALSAKHVEFLRRFCILPGARQPVVQMVYDTDETGRKATFGWVDDSGKRRFGALQLLDRAGISRRNVPYSGFKDPGQVWDRGGAAAVRATFGKVIDG